MCQWINDSGRFMRYPWIIGPMALAHFTNMRVILLLGYSKAELWGIKGVFIEIIQPNAMADSKNWILDVDNDGSEIRVIKFKNLVINWCGILHMRCYNSSKYWYYCLPKKTKKHNILVYVSEKTNMINSNRKWVIILNAHSKQNLTK